MYILKRFYGSRFDRMNAIIDGLGSHIASYINVAGNATLPLPEVGEANGLPANACRAEGHRDARLGPATTPMDEAEALVEDRTRALFALDGSYEINAQPHSATQANQIVFRAVLDQPGQCVAGLSPSDGGHISHSLGLPASATFVPLPLAPEGIDYDAIPGVLRSSRPTVIVAGATSYTRSIDWGRLRLVDIRGQAPKVPAVDHGWMPSRLLRASPPQSLRPTDHSPFEPTPYAAGHSSL